MRKKSAMLSGLAALAAVACGERLPTSVDEGLLPGDLVSVEVRLPWDAFASGLEVFGGYGSARELGSGVLARAYAGTLDAHTLVRFAPMPGSVTVTDTTGTQRSDSDLTLVGGRIVAFLDTLQSSNEGPVTLELGALHQPWDEASASWMLAVDTAGEATPWQEAGAGPVTSVVTTVWDPSAGDSAVFALDSAQVEAWRDSASVNQGARLAVLTEGVRIKVDNVVLRAAVAPSVRPDTLVDLTGARLYFTFVYTPSPGPAAGGIRIGGVPAWRTVLDIAVPASLDGPAALCAAVGCPVRLTADRINYAALVLHSRRGEPAFQPLDSLGLDVRPVYSRSALPKAPLGASLFPSTLGRRVPADYFGAGEGREVELPITAFVRALVEGDSIRGFPPPRTLALLSVFEPSSIAYASFHGPGTAEAPLLRLIVTAGRSVQLP